MGAKVKVCMLAPAAVPKLPLRLSPRWLIQNTTIRASLVLSYGARDFSCLLPDVLAVQ
jgi:hypothetical protein